MSTVFQLGIDIARSAGVAAFIAAVLMAPQFECYELYLSDAPEFDEIAIGLGLLLGLAIVCRRLLLTVLRAMAFARRHGAMAALSFRRFPSRRIPKPPPDSWFISLCDLRI
jgi:hypothetical protein